MEAFAQRCAIAFVTAPIPSNCGRLVSATGPQRIGGLPAQNRQKVDRSHSVPRAFAAWCARIKLIRGAGALQAQGRLYHDQGAQ
jgi:hypothetical protein